MSLKILAKKVQAKSIATNHGQLTRGYRVNAIKEDAVPKTEFNDMIMRLRKLAHRKEKSAGTVNQINLEAAKISSMHLSRALDSIEVQMGIHDSIAENPLMSTVTVASNVLKFKQDISQDL